MINLSNSERKRPLQALAFQERVTLVRELPLDAVIKRIQIRLSGSVVTTFASGTPVADQFSTFDNIVERIEVIVGGRRTVKSVRPYFMQQKQLLLQKTLGERKSSAAAAAATNNNPTADGGFAYGTTTQTTTVAETIEIPFEMVFAEQGKGREQCYLNLRGETGAVIKIVCKSLSALLGFGNEAPVVFSSQTFQFDITLIETKFAPDPTDGKYEYFDYRENEWDQPFTGQVSNFPINLPTGNLISGVGILTRDGAAGSATTASGKLRTNNLFSKMSFKLSGNEEIQATTFLEQQAANRARFAPNAPYGSNVSRLDGYVFFDFLQNGDIASALNVVDRASNPVLYVDTNSGSVVSYTNPAMATIHVEEISPAR